jgi:hypothetical protein
MAFARSGHIWHLKFIFVCHIWLLMQMHVTNAQLQMEAKQAFGQQKTKLLLFLSLAV